MDSVGLAHYLQGSGNARQELIGNAKPQGRPGDRMARQMGEGLAGKTVCSAPASSFPAP